MSENFDEMPGAAIYVHRSQREMARAVYERIASTTAPIASLAPLAARLDELAGRARPEMSDAAVEAFSDADLSALLDVKFEVARRRQRWLEERISGCCE